MAETTIPNHGSDEQWALVVGNHDYEVSTHARVRRATEAKNTAIGRLLKPQFNCHGYVCVTLCGPNLSRRLRSIHRLVAEAFLSPVEGSDYVNHVDGDKSNAHLSNLEWCTQSENCRHAYRAGLMPDFDRKGAANGNSKLKADDVRAIRALSASGISGAEIGRRYSITTAHACDIIKGGVWKHLT